MRVVDVVENYVEFEKRRVGLEYEQPLTDASGNVVKSDVVQAMHSELLGLGWEGKPDKISGNILSVDKKFSDRNANISTDCGWSTLELALPPQDSLFDAERVLDKVRGEALTALSKQNVRLLGIGLVPGLASANEKYKTKRPVQYVKEKDKLWMHNTFVPLNAHQVGVSVRLDEGVNVLNQLFVFVR